MNRPLLHPFLRPLLRAIASASAAAAALTLAGCAVQPTSTILSRLPEQSASGPGQTHALTPAERKRYDEIDKQVLREQNAAIAADEAMRAWYYAPPPPVTFYGGYWNGGWGPGWGGGYGYGYPGW
ncbi:hypothetical protein [Burkholderia guangdongensis]|uniref:hypothetical protein n=1 Tax=Burkholderia guangdongensis TaxID=1792500 RepID=UPI0015C989D9|nr:hypothetical protein [Burkholderia guangdongensis]